jgi:CubicO group peptidase (beta-lactamase class C family)
MAGQVEPKAARRLAGGLAVLLVVAAAVLALWQTRQGRPHGGDPGTEIQQILLNEIASNRAVKNCVVAVAKGDGSFSWSGAAGVAKRDGELPMTVDTPIYIASTKLYTATIIMMLEERGLVALDHEIKEYLPRELIQGIHVYAGQDHSEQITLYELLSHRSGIADYYSDTGTDGKSAFELFLDRARPIRTRIFNCSARSSKALLGNR